MTREKDSARSESARQKGRGKSPANAAFDTWLERGLHTLYDNVKNEPVPEDLLRLLDEFKDASEKK